MKTQSPIPWPTLTAEEKAKTFFDAMGVKPTIYCKYCGRMNAPCEKHPSATRIDYPPLTLDALFAICRERKLYADVSQVARVAFATLRKSMDWEKGDTEIDALAIALLRHAGFEISTEGKV